MTAALLELKGMDKRFGGLHVTRNVSFSLSAGDRMALIGPNGAGKTTLVNQISGVLQPDAGAIHLLGEDVTRLQQAKRVRRGLARTFQITTLAPHFPVQRQVELALLEREGLTGRAWRSVDAYPDLQAEALELLTRFGLRDHAATATQDLAYGEQRMVEMALALALRPRVLLLDEPMAGVPKGDGGRLLAALESLPRSLAVLIIEHDMDLVMQVTDRIVVKPTWTEWDRSSGEIVIDIDPQMAFGTGEHATTRGCLRLLDSAVRAGDRVLDVGSGSAILAIAARVSDNKGAAVSLVMATRVVPGFFLGTLGGVIIDRFDRRKVMVVCSVGRAALLRSLPFDENLRALVLVSFGLEILTLLWGPAQAASVPNLVESEQLASANSLSLLASF